MMIDCLGLEAANLNLIEFTSCSYLGCYCAIDPVMAAIATAKVSKQLGTLVQVSIHQQLQMVVAAQPFQSCFFGPGRLQLRHF